MSVSTLQVRAWWHRSTAAPHLDVFLGEKPRPVGQDLVELAQVLQLLRRSVQAVEPLVIATDLEEVIHVQIDQIGALVSGCSL